MGFDEIGDQLAELHEKIKEGKIDNEILASHIDRLTELVIAINEELKTLNERVFVLTEAAESKGEKKKLGIF